MLKTRVLTYKREIHSSHFLSKQKGNLKIKINFDVNRIHLLR